MDTGHLKKLPSWLAGAAAQTMATLPPPRRFYLAGKGPVVLVPGAFCTRSVMNGLGTRMQALGFGVAVPPSFPYGVSALANLCRLERAVGVYRSWLRELMERHGIESAVAAGHSNGGLIVLLELATRQPGAPLPEISKVVTMASPLRGFPAARQLAPLIPCCRDIHPGSGVLRIVEPVARKTVTGYLVAGNDFLVPPENQYILEEKAVNLEGFQHMDFVVGRTAKIDRTALVLASILG
ncbi:MAG: alpha/beta hydrolase [Deltaproteobacteria bacterium]|nr:MAG: alpha/beta hydrolase [Deltaproteobacteria bacterium]